MESVAPLISCPEQIPLHVLEELWDALELTTTDESKDVQSDTLIMEDSVLSLEPLLAFLNAITR